MLIMEDQTIKIKGAEFLTSCKEYPQSFQGTVNQLVTAMSKGQVCPTSCAGMGGKVWADIIGLELQCMPAYCDGATNLTVLVGQPNPGILLHTHMVNRSCKKK